MELEFRIAKVEESEIILEFLRKYFYSEEPVTIGIEPKEPSQEDEECLIGYIKYGTTVMAVDKSQKVIAGIIIAGIIDTNYANSLMVESKNTSDYKWKHIAKLLAKLQTNANIFTRYQVQESLHIHALAVNEHYRGKSIGRRLMEQIFALGKMLKYSLISVDCTGCYSINLAVQMNMDHVATMKYCEYRDENGLEVFKVHRPHTEIKSFVKKV